MKKNALVTLFMAGLLTAASAEVIYLDFYDDGTINSSPETYNVLHSDASNGQTHPVATAGSGLSMTGLVDTTGAATGAGVTLHSYSAFRTAGGLAEGGAYAHEAVAGIATNATQDAYWINDQGNAASFGFILTFTGLTGAAYDLSMLAGSSNAGGTWSVKTGFGDSGTQAYSSAQTEVQEWTSVVPVNGTIELRSLDDGSGNWQTASINFIALEAVELANSILGLSPDTLSLNLNAPDTSIGGTIAASFFPGVAENNVEILSLVADAGFSASVANSTLGVANPDEDIIVTFDNSAIGLQNGESTNSTLIVTWSEEGSSEIKTSEVALAVTYTDEPNSLALVPTTLALSLIAPDTSIDGTLLASYVEGTLPADVEVVSLVADAGFSAAPGSFTLGTANTNQDITVTFDNASIGLADLGDATNSTLVVTWTEAGSGVTNTSDVALSVSYTPESLDPADIVYEGTALNSTFVYNVVSGKPATGSLTDIGGNLIVTNEGVNFGMVGFASTDDINTLNGAALTVEDVVTIKIVVESITGNLRANGVNFGMVSDVAFASGTSNLLVKLEAANSGSDISIFSSFQDDGDIGFNTSDALLKDGFTLTLIADVDGYSFVLEGVNASVIKLEGTFAGNEFLDYFSTGHFYYTAQKWNTTTPLVTTVNDALIYVKSTAAVQPVVSESYVSDGNFNVVFTGTVGKEYGVECTDNLAHPEWETVMNFPSLPESPITVTWPATNNAAFYRVFTP